MDCSTRLKNELETDPLERGYAGMTDLDAAADLNIEYRTRIKAALTGDEIFQATDSPEFASLTDSSKNLWLSFCGRASVNPSGSANVGFIQWVFGNPSQTRTNLLTLRSEIVSRAVELILGCVRQGEVETARRP